MKSARLTIMLPAIALALGTSASFAQKTPSQPTPTSPPGPVPNPTAPAPQASAPVTPTVQLPSTLPGTPQAAPAVPSPRSFEMIVKDAQAMPGFFPLYEKDEKVWIELKPEHFNTPFYLSISRTRGLGENFI